MKCPKCNEKIEDNASFCSKCGYNLTNGKSVSNVTYRSPEFILGLIASIYGLFMIIAFVFLSDIDKVFYGIIGLITLTLGIIGIYLLRINRGYGGVMMIISAILYLIAIPYVGFPSVILMGLGGLLALFKK